MVKRFFIVTVFIVFSGLFFLILDVSQKGKEHDQIKIYDTIHKILDTVIVAEKSTLLSLTIASSRSRSIQDVLLRNKRTEGYSVLRANTDILKAHTDKKDIYMQIITKDLSIFARSWESNISNIPLATGKKSLLRHLLKNRIPRSGLDIGIPFGVKALSVIMYKNSILGILEAVVPYDNIVSKMRAYHIEVIPLLYKNFIPLRYQIEKKISLFKHKYIVANSNKNNGTNRLLYDLSREEFALLMQQDSLLKSPYLYLSYPILSNKNVKLGNFIAIIKKSDFAHFTERPASVFQSIYTLDSTRDDIYHYAKETEVQLFRDIQKEYIAKLKYTIDEKDLVEFENVAYGRLMKMSKEELVELILYRNSPKKLRGPIR